MQFPGFSLEVRPGWCDITSEVEGNDSPWTLAKPDGFGAFQFSIALYRSGIVPDPSSRTLLSLLRDFASAEKFGEPQDVITEDTQLRLAAASFREGHDFIRVWYVSDGSSFAKVTFVCEQGKHSAEVADCEQMVRSFRFADEATEAAANGASPRR